MRAYLVCLQSGCWHRKYLFYLGMTQKRNRGHSRPKKREVVEEPDVDDIDFGNSPHVPHHIAHPPSPAHPQPHPFSSSASEPLSPTPLHAPLAGSDKQQLPSQQQPHKISLSIKRHVHCLKAETVITLPFKVFPQLLFSKTLV